MALDHAEYSAQHQNKCLRYIKISRYLIGLKFRIERPGSGSTWDLMNVLWMRAYQPYIENQGIGRRYWVSDGGWVHVCTLLQFPTVNFTLHHCLGILIYFSTKLVKQNLNLMRFCYKLTDSTLHGFGVCG